MDDPANASARVRALEGELQALRADLHDYTYTVSHDLRASLRHVISYLQLLHEDCAELLPPEALGFLQTAQDSARHMGLMVDGLSELARLGKVPLQCQPVALADLVREAVQEVARRHPGRAIDWQLQDDMPAVETDASLVRAAVLHLLDNAAKFSAASHPAHIAVTAVSVPHPDGPPGAVRLQVRDNGVGFADGQQARLFRPFQRLHSAERFAGLGLGLAFTARIAQRLGGSVDIRATPGAGCCASLLLGTLCITPCGP